MTKPTVQSVERAFSLLRALSVAPAGVSQLAQAASLPKSTVARLLVTLEAAGAVDRVGESTEYRIGDGLLALTGSLSAAATMMISVRPYLVQLVDTLGEAAGFCVPEGYAMQFLGQVESPRPVQVRDYSGAVIPMHVTPAGLSVMAQWPSDDIERYLSRPLQSYTVHTVVDPVAVHERLEIVRRLGYVWADEEYAEGLSSVAAPVFDAQSRVVGAINVHGPTYRFPQRIGLEKAGEQVRDCAALFSRHGAVA